MVGGESSRVFVHFRRIDISEVPDRDDLQDWVMDVFRRKDDHLANYYTNDMSIEQAFGVSNLVEIKPDWISSSICVAVITLTSLAFWLWIPYGVLIQFSFLAVSMGHMFADLYFEEKSKIN